MLTVHDLEPHIEREFGSRLEPLGFQRLGQRRWIRTHKLPIRELFTICALKGGSYCPSWGMSSGVVPSFRAQSFRRQSTDKNAIMDLVIDPIDTTGVVPPEAFGFISGLNTEIPVRQIRICAEHFLRLALADFERVTTIADFCKFFLERSRLQYRRFLFDMYTQHQLVSGFVYLLTGERAEGLERIRRFCASMGADCQDTVLLDCIRHAETLRTTA